MAHTRRSSAGFAGAIRLGRTGPSPWPSGGSILRMALGRRGITRSLASHAGGPAPGRAAARPAPATSCGSHCVLGGGSEGGGAPLRVQRAMKEAAKRLDFERAAERRDRVKALRKIDLEGR